MALADLLCIQSELVNCINDPSFAEQLPIDQEMAQGAHNRSRTDSPVQTIFVKFWKQTFFSDFKTSGHGM